MESIIQRTGLVTWFWKIADILYSWSIKKLKALTHKDLLSQSVIFQGRKLVAIGDGTKQMCKDFVDKDESLSIYSGKKGYGSITKFVWVTPKGNPILISYSYRGALVDINILSDERYILNIPEDTFVGVDGGIKGIKNFYKNYIIPVEARGRELTKDEKDWNDGFKRFRTVVENYFCAIKKFKFLSDKFRYNGGLEEILAKHHLIWVICAVLMKEFIYIDGLRV